MLSGIGRVAALSAALSGVGMVPKAPAQVQPVTNPAVAPAAPLPTAPADPGAEPGSMARVPLSQVIDDVLRSHPEVAAAQARYEAALQRPPQERALPDPMMSTGYGSAGAPYPGAGLGEDPMPASG